MDKIVGGIKRARRTVWNDFKDFLKNPGYKYYEMPKELKFRYPAPGSVAEKEDFINNCDKTDWSTPYEKSGYNIRPHAPEEIPEPEISTRGHKVKLDPNNPEHAKILEGPLRDENRYPDTIEYLHDTRFGAHFDKSSARENLHKFFEEQKQVEELDDVDVYDPKMLVFYERGVTETGADPIIQDTFLGLEDQLENEVGRERIETQQMHMYKGEVKKWQVLDEQQFGREEIDKLQASIKAPLSGELDQFKEESEIPMPLPISNANVYKWRDERRAIDTADFDSKLLEEQKKTSEEFFLKRYQRPKQLD